MNTNTIEQLSNKGIKELLSKTNEMMNFLDTLHSDASDNLRNADKAISKIYHDIEKGNFKNNEKAVLEELRQALITRRIVKENNTIFYSMRDKLLNVIK